MFILGFLYLFFQVDNATKTIQKAKVKAEVLKASKCLLEILKNAKYNGSYFDRTEKESDRLCTREGWFTCQVWHEFIIITELYLLPFSSWQHKIQALIHGCAVGSKSWRVQGRFREMDLLLIIFIPRPLQGSFDEKMCRSLHSINPYSSRETRIVFSTWNLDHRSTLTLPAENSFTKHFQDYFF